MLGLPPAGQVAPDSARRPCTGCAYVEDPADFVLQGSYYDTRRFDVTLILNNKGPDPLPVELTVYSLHGRRLDLTPQELPAQSANMLSLNELLRDAGAPFREGSLEVRYRYEGCALVLSAGILLEDPAAGISFDELLTRTFQRASNRLEGLWWVPSRSSKLELVLSNQSESEVTATVSGRSLGRTAQRRSLSVNLGPRETRVLNLPRVWTLEEEMGRGAWAAGSLSVTYEGAPSDLVARGMVEDRALRYSGVVEFADPAAGVGSELDGAGWRLGAFEGTPLAPVLVVRNIADEASTVTIRIPYSESEGATGRLELEPVALEPGEMRDLSAEVFAATQDLARLQGVTTGLELTSTGAPGTLLAAAESVTLDGDQVFRLPLVDPQTKGAAGNYPWVLSHGKNTSVYLKNVTGEAKEYTVQIDFAGGSYVLGAQSLAPSQTLVLDLRAIRDSQTPDLHGQTIPLDAESGQVRWSALGGDVLHSMLGRSEYVSAAAGVSSTFACSSCCPDSFNNAFVDPNPGEGLWGDALDLHVYRQNRDCYGNIGGAIGVAGTWYWDGDQKTSLVASWETTVDGQYHVVLVQLTEVYIWYATYVTGWVCHSYPHQAVVQSQVDPGNCAHPVNFHQVSASDDGNGTLHFKYSWDSSTGDRGDLSQCDVGEYVTYPAEYLPSPPFPVYSQPLPNPRENWVGATSGQFDDFHSTPGTFVKPYAATSFVGTQKYRFRCQCINDDLPADVSGFVGLSITRSVSQKPDGTWKFTVTKPTNGVATIDLPD